MYFVPATIGKPGRTGLLCSLVLLVAGCERQTSPTGGAAVSPEGSLPANLILSAEPSSALGVKDAKASSDEELVVRGRIGGRVDPFVAGSAIFVLVDKSLKMCNERHGDGCRTPWDYCCEPREDLIAGMAIVQVVGDDGRPLNVDLRGRSGLEPGAEVVVVGRRAPGEDAGTLVIDARGIYVVKR
jgi:hypothetical protein